jgi:molybdopterin-biosynthesis enzyme MoeA-like protein
MPFGLIVVGDEILSGKRQDKHMAAVIGLLAERGLSLEWARYVGDDPERQCAVLREAFASGDVVFSCGGIGATPDDHTRQAAGAALGRPLVLHPEAHGFILERMRETAAEQGQAYEPDRPDNVHRLNMARFPEGARVIPNPYNKIAGFSVERVHFVPGFPVMAHPMIAWVLDQEYAHLHRAERPAERSVIVIGGMEATLTPLMESVQTGHPGVRVFSLPSVSHPQWGRHIELGVKGQAEAVPAAFATLLDGLHALGAQLGPELVRP